MIGIRTCAKLWAMMREDDFLRHPGELAAASLFGTSPHHRDLTKEVLDEMAQTYCERVAENIRRRRDELGRDPSEFEGFLAHLLEGPDDILSGQIVDVARALQVNPAVLLMPHAWDPEADPSDGWLDEGDDLEPDEE